MSKNRKYPRLDSIRQLKKKKQCSACDQLASNIIWVQFTWMRGEDEDYYGCTRHVSIAKKDINRFLSHVETKSKFLEGK